MFIDVFGICLKALYTLSFISSGRVVFNTGLTFQLHIGRLSL